MTKMKNMVLRIVLLGTTCCLLLAGPTQAGTTWLERQKLLVSDGASGDCFGYSISISGDYAIIGAWGDDAEKGSAYIFKWDGTGWSWQQKLTAFDGAAGDSFGRSVSISGDYAIIGAYGDEDKGRYSGSAYVFKRDGTSWSQQAKLTADDGAEYDFFGFSVSISGDYAIIGADQYYSHGAGSAYIFKRDGESWNPQAKLTASDGVAEDWFGWSVSISGDYAIIGAWGNAIIGVGGVDIRRGSAYMFKRDGTSWSPQQKLTASDGAAYDEFGHSVFISGDYAIIGAYNDDDKGSAYMFKRDGTSWSQQAKLTADDGAAGDEFGYFVSISGDYAIVGADQYYSGYDSGNGKAYIFKRDGTGWSQQQKLTALDGAAGDWFGFPVSISGDCAIVGAPRDDDMGTDSGSAYIFVFGPPAEYTLTVNITGSGTVAKNPEKATYHYGDVVELTANPNTGWQFSAWSGDLTGSENPKTITIDGSKTVTATFTQITPASAWSFVTIPDLPTGALLGRLWTDRPGNLYVWAQTNEPRAILYHWNGKSWSQVLNLPAHGSGGVFGTGSSDIFASATEVVEVPNNPTKYNPKMYHFDGNVWMEQQLPANLSGGIAYIVGEPGNLYAFTSPLLHYDGTAWHIDFSGFVGDEEVIVYISQNEIYVLKCWGHWLWNGNTWVYYPGFDFCDLWAGGWGMRDNQGKLHLYTAGCNNWQNGVRIWRFTETYPGSKVGSWGSRDGIFCDPSPCLPVQWGVNGPGKADGIWGSGPNDIYVSGDLYGTGRVYHFDGTEWKRITDFGYIPPAGPVGGSGPDDVWVSDGDRLLHYGPYYGPPVINVTIDIKPSNVPVAILSSTTFDALTVDRSTVEFAGARPLPNYCSQLGEIPEDVNGDGLLDIVFYFKIQDLNLPPGDTEACLTGRTFSGQEFRGCDSVLDIGLISGDLDGNGKVDFADFARFVENWLKGI
jgi:uncharacterized repeat protein (TIGR02543 family)